MLVATFNETTGWAGKTISYENDQFILEGHGAVTAAHVMEYDGQGQLAWPTEGTRAWVCERADAGRTSHVGPWNPYYKMLTKTRKVYDANGGPRRADRVLVGKDGQSLVVLPDQCIIVKPAHMRIPGSYKAFRYSDVTDIRTYERNTVPVVQVLTRAAPVSPANADPAHSHDCFVGSSGERARGETIACADDVRRRAHLLDSVNELLAVVRDCTLVGGHGLELTAGHNQDLFFGSDELALRDCLDGRMHIRIPYASIQIIDVGGRGAEQHGGGFIGGGFGLEGAVTGMLVGSALNLLTTRTTIDTIICLRTDFAEVYFHTSRHTPDAVRMGLSRVFAALRQLEAARAAAASSNQKLAPKTSVADEIAKLADLHAKGLVTDEEYAALKAKLIAD